MMVFLNLEILNKRKPCPSLAYNAHQSKLFTLTSIIMDLIQQGIEKGLIRFDEDRKNIFYIYQNVRRNYTNPEEQVQAETFLKLVLDYKYPVERIRQFVTVQMGVSKKQADIIIYNDDACLSPYIIVECKNQEITDLEFKQAVDQAFSYAVAEGALYVWVTSGIADEYFLVDKGKTKARKTKTNIPKFGFDTTDGLLLTDDFKDPENDKNIRQGLGNAGFKRDGFYFIATIPPFGSSIKKAEINQF